GPSSESLVYQHMSVASRPVTELRPSVPGAVAAALQRALAKTAADRYETAGRFGASLEAEMPSPAREPAAITGVQPAIAPEGGPATRRPRPALVGARLLLLPPLWA